MAAGAFWLAEATVPAEPTAIKTRPLRLDAATMAATLLVSFTRSSFPSSLSISLVLVALDPSAQDAVTQTLAYPAPSFAVTLSDQMSAAITIADAARRLICVPEHTPTMAVGGGRSPIYFHPDCHL
jgi:hypothetical protein